MVKPTQHLFLDLPKVSFIAWGSGEGMGQPLIPLPIPTCSLAAGGAAGALAGAVLGHGGLDGQCSLHHSLLDPGWAQTPLHHPRPEVGHACAPGWLPRQGGSPLAPSVAVSVPGHTLTVGPMLA